MLVMAESNFYQALAIIYLDLVIFGTACCIIYEDDQHTIHCHNPALGEFYLAQDERHIVTTLGRDLWMDARQMNSQFGYDNLSDQVKREVDKGGAESLHQHMISHLIEPKDYEKVKYGNPNSVYECFWEKGRNDGVLLSEGGYRNFPAIAPRWELTANDVYGSSPGMDAIGDTIQLQHETKRKAQGLDKTISPPLLADIQLQNAQTQLFPNGITYVAGVNNIGVKPAYQIAVPFGEISADIQDVRQRIQQIFHNDLFAGISQLDTVRSAAEIAARQEEKLVQLGPVLERFESEALGPAIERVYDIMQAKGLLPVAPASIQSRSISIQYVSILATAQSASATAGTERWLQLLGGMVNIWPEVKAIPDSISLATDYGRDVGVPMKSINTSDKINQKLQAANQSDANQLALEQSVGAAKTAQVLSDTDVGGGANALQVALGRAA